MIPITDKRVQQYIDGLTEVEDPVLAAISAEASRSTVFAKMLTGNYQGQLLTMLVAMLQPQHVLEIGTFSGYSAICIAKGMGNKGQIITIEYNEELQDTIEQNIQLAGYSHMIKPKMGDAMRVIQQLDMNFDFVFIDADKKNYLNYFKMILPKLNPGAVVITDNVLWNGNVADDTISDAETTAIREFNNFVKDLSGFQKILLPVRDGLFLIRKLL